MEENKDVKCGRCKSYKYPSQFLKDGRRLKTCNDCRRINNEWRERNKCPHGRQKVKCKECGGVCICEHNRIRNTCKECGGASICQHGRQKSQCKECGGASICEHNRIRNLCKECGGTSICQHNRLRITCKECDFKGYLSDIVRGRVKSALKHNKELSSFEYLGCDIGLLKEHIEKQFIEGMSWDNYGEWHIDHIVPLKYDNPSLEEVCERLHYTNTQPLWATDNISKGNRYVG